MSNDSAAMHRQAWDMIPWIVNGSARESERVAIEEHLQGCSDCRAELEFQRQLQGAVVMQGPTELESREGWQRLKARVESSPRAEPVDLAAMRRARRSRRAWVPWLTAAMILQTLGLGVFGALLWTRSGAPTRAAADLSATYRTLSAPQSSPPEATIRVVLAPQMTLERLHALLQQNGLRVVAGPSDAGVWSLAPVEDAHRPAPESQLRALRADTDVRFAEAVGSVP